MITMTVADYIEKIIPLCKTDRHEYLEELLVQSGRHGLKDVTLEEAAEYYEMLSQRISV